MFKHANTLQPGDRVCKKQNGVKLAGDGARGKVTDVAPDAESFRILFDDGHTDFVRPEDLEKI